MQSNVRTFHPHAKSPYHIFRDINLIFLAALFHDDGFDAGNISISHLFPFAILPLFPFSFTQHENKILGAHHSGNIIHR